MSVSGKENDVAKCLDVLFKRLDAAKLVPLTILKSESHKEHYESVLMLAFRRLIPLSQVAQYVV